MSFAAICGCGSLRISSPNATLSATRQMREERVALEHEARIALPRRLPRNVAPAKADLAGGWCDETGDHAQRRRLAAPGRPEQHHELALPDVEIDVGDRAEIAVRLGETNEFQARHGVALQHPGRA